MSVVRPGQRTRLAGVAGHSHIPGVAEPPSMQRVLLHRRYEKSSVRRACNIEMRAFPLENRGFGGGIREPQRCAIVVGEGNSVTFGQ